MYKINRKVNVNNSPYSILIRKSRSDSSLDLVISDLLCERSLKLYSDGQACQASSVAVGLRVAR